jgi:hypothetical protein
LLSAVLALSLSGALQAAPVPVREGLKYRDFDDLVRCTFIMEAVCARLVAGDRKGASAFMGDPEAEDFRDLPDNLGAIKSCRRVSPARAAKGSQSRSDMALLLGYGSGPTQEVGLRFGVLGDRSCGCIAALEPQPSRMTKDGKVYVRYFLSTRQFQEGDDAAESESVTDIVERVRPEKDDSSRSPAPREVYIGKVLEQVLAERERREAEKDPLNRPLIQKE